MYEINLVEKVIVRSQKNLKAVKFLKVLSLLMTIAILALGVLCVYTFIKVYETEEKINQIKIGIDEKRRIYRLKDVEAEWTLNYNKILAVNNLISNNTKAGLLLRDVGMYIPAGDKIGTFELTDKNEIKESVKIKNFNEKYDIQGYAEILKDSYLRSSFFGEPITIAEKSELISVNGRNIDVVFVTIPYVTEKK